MAVGHIQSTLRLRPLTLDDLPLLLQWDQDTELASLMGKKFAAERDAYVWWDGLSPQNGRLGYAITLNGSMIGDIELEHISWRSGEAEVRICIGDRTLWNHGYGTEAMSLLLQHAFSDLGLRLVYLRVWQTNLRAVRSYQKIGFRKRGRLPATGRLTGVTELWLMDLTRRAFYQRRGGSPKAASARLPFTPDW